MGSSSSKLSQFLTVDQLNLLLRDFEATSPTVTVTVIASHIQKDLIEETVSKKINKGMHIKNKQTGQVVSVDDNRQVILEEESVSLGQCWIWDGIGIGKNLKNLAHDGVLDVVDGTNVGLRRKDTFAKHQEWRLEGSFISTELMGKKVLDSSPEGKVIFWEKHGGKNQQWDLSQYSFYDIFIIQNRGNKSVLEVSRDSRTGNQELRMAPKKMSIEQHWSWKGNSNLLVNYATGLVLDLLGPGKVGVYQSHGGPNQRWMMNQRGHVSCLQGEQVLDVDNRGRVVMSQAHEGASQKWDIRPVTRNRMQETKVETFRESRSLSISSSQDLSPKSVLPAITAEYPVLKVC